jgi:hypothetical protein|tara:strand:- start:76 stop:891 length:816 start_codon:yes stop_codon:yes gene_type:complete
LEEAAKYNFIFLEDYEKFSGVLLSFLRLNYSSGLETEAEHEISFFEWLFSKGGCLGVAREEEKWVAVYPVGKLTLKYKNDLFTVYHAALVCVNKDHRFKGLAQKIVKKTDDFLKRKYNLAVSGVGATGLRIPTTFKDFNVLTCTKVKRPKEKVFSSHNFFLTDETSFFTRYLTEEGEVLCYPLTVTHKGKREKWGIIASYFTKGSWNGLIFEACHNKLLKQFDRVLIFENYERKANALTEMGFEKFSSFNLYVDSVGKIPARYLYYNLFLF